MRRLRCYQADAEGSPAPGQEPQKKHSAKCGCPHGHDGAGDLRHAAWQLPQDPSLCGRVLALHLGAFPAHQERR